ncbi:MAG: CvpA family protein [Culturomica sp.]|jgi:membrane protein required for colicin V production|nr:CvpA family protein [Culturomica sp.]
MWYVDVVVLILLVYGAYKGFTKGLVMEISTLLALIFGVYLAMKFSTYTEDMLREYCNVQSKYTGYIALAITFLIVVICVNIIGKLITKLVGMVALSFLNKFLGALFGVLKILLFICVILLLVDTLDDKYHFMSNEIKDGSFFYNPCLHFAQKIYNAIKF